MAITQTNPSSSYVLQPIGILSTCFKEKFGIPRQSGLVKSAKGILKLNNDPLFHYAIRQLEGFSHLWIIFVFHKLSAKNWKPSIRPPRLGGSRKVGVLASRSPHRPNPIGLSAVSLERIDLSAKGGIEIHLGGIDLLDGTPVLDIKPYIPYADAVTDAHAGWANAPLQTVPVVFSEQSLKSLSSVSVKKYPHLQNLITEILSQDPRPAFQKKRFPHSSPHSQETCYGFQLLEFNIRWKITNGQFYVLDVLPVT
jgi:tRNA-Thr(GGU) m(6)t(6)A37 methyltransferase TsaA